MILYILFLCSFFFAQTNSNKLDTDINTNSIDSLSLDNPLNSPSLTIDSLLNGSQGNDIFYE